MKKNNKREEKKKTNNAIKKLLYINNEPITLKETTKWSLFAIYTSLVWISAKLLTGKTKILGIIGMLASLRLLTLIAEEK